MLATDIVRWSLCLALVPAVLVRVSLTSLVYLLCMTAALWVRSTQVSRVLRATLLISVFVCSGLVAFQIALAANSPYGHTLPAGSPQTALWRQIGYTRLDGDAVSALRMVLPDVVVLVICILLTFFSAALGHRLRKYSTPDLAAVLNTTPLFVLLVGCCAGVLPSAFGAGYGLIFVIALIDWVAPRSGANRSSRRKSGLSSLQRWLRRCAAVLVACQLVLTYGAQFDVIHDHLASAYKPIGLIQYIDFHGYIASPLDLPLLHLPWSQWAALATYGVAMLLFSYSIRRTKRRARHQRRLGPEERQVQLAADRHDELTPLLVADAGHGQAAHDSSYVTSALSPPRHGRETDERYHMQTLVDAAPEPMAAVRQDEAANDETGQRPRARSKPSRPSLLKKASRMFIHFIRSSLWLVSCIVMAVWAFTFPSWFGLLLFVWACFGTMFHQHLPYTFPALLLFCMGFIAIEFVANFPGVDWQAETLARQFGLVHDNVDAAFVAMTAQTACVAVIAACVRFGHVHHGQPRASAASAATADTQHGRGPASANPTSGDVVSATRRRLRIVAAFGVFVLEHYSYVITLGVIFGASLDTVSVLNATYLVILVLFVAFPKLRSKGWILIVLYCQSVIVLVYLWGFPFAQSVPKKATDLMGLDIDAHKHLWSDLRWQCTILVFSLLQLYAYRRDSKWAAEVVEQTLQGTNVIMHFAGHFWDGLSLVCLFLVGILGTVTYIRLGYLAVLSALFSIKYLRLRKLETLFWLISLLYGGCILVACYLYQFSSVRDDVERWLPEDFRKHVGLHEQHSQAQLFKYLLPPALVLVACVVRTRLSLNHDARIWTFLMRRKGSFWTFVQQAATLCGRMTYFVKDWLVIFMTFASVLLPRAQAKDIVTLLLLALFLTFSKRRGLFAFLMMQWMEAVVLCKLLFQPLEATVTKQFNPDTLEWIGIELLSKSEKPVDYVSWELAVLASLVFRQLLTNARKLLWPDAANPESPASSSKRTSMQLLLTEEDDSAEADTNLSLTGFADMLRASFHVFDKDICLIVLMTAALCRLNYMSLVYLGMMVPFMKWDDQRLRRHWRGFVIVVMTMLLYQYVALLGLPPSVDYPWANLESKHRELRVLFRWLYLPPLEDSLARAPSTWTSSPILYCDFVCLVVLGLLVRPTPTRTVDSADSTNNIVLRGVAAIFPWFVVLLTFLSFLSRQDLFAIGYFVFSVMILSDVANALQAHTSTGRLFRFLRWYIVGVISIHMLFILPALLVKDWSSNESWLKLVSTFGLRYGVGVKLLPKDPDPIHALWTSNSGILLEFLSFIFLSLYLAVRRLPWFEAMSTQIGTALERSQTISKRIPELIIDQIKRRQREDEKKLVHSRQLLSLVMSRGTQAMNTDAQTAKWFSSNDLEEISAIQTSASSLRRRRTSRTGSSSSSRDGPGRDSEEPIPKAAGVGQTSSAEAHNSGEESLEKGLVGVTSVATQDLDGNNRKSVSDEDASSAQNEGKTRPSRWKRFLGFLVAFVHDRNKKNPLVQLLVAEEARNIAGAGPLSADGGDATLPEPLMKLDGGDSEDGTAESTSSAEADPDVAVPEASLRALATQIYYFVISHTSWLCYFMIILNALLVGSLLSMLQPVFLFMWGSLSRPYPSKKFWQFMMLYTALVLLLRYMFQFDFWGTWNELEDVDCQGSAIRKDCESNAAVLLFGLWRAHNTRHYLTALLPDAFLLLTLLIHKTACIRLGVWDLDVVVLMQRLIRQENGAAFSDFDDLIDEQEYGLDQATDSVLPLTASAAELRDETAETDGDDGDDDKDELQAGEDIEDADDEELSNSSSTGTDPANGRVAGDGSAASRLARAKQRAVRYWGTVRRFFSWLVNDSFSEPKDYYIRTFLVEFASFMLICFGWNGFRSKTDYKVSTASYIKDNNIPTDLLIYMILQFAIIVIDRTIYLTRAIKVKLVFHYALVVLIHCLVFLWLPYSTNRSLRDNGVIFVLYCLKAIYFVLSAAQIRATYPYTVFHNALTRHPDQIGSIIYTIYRVIPFLLELRILLDWSCTKTTLTFFDWVKLEDINGQLFENLCHIKSLERSPRKIGEAQSLRSKFTFGALMLVLLMFILWFPLFLMSFINSQAVPYPPYHVELSVSINAYEPIFTMDALASSEPLSREDYNMLLDMDPSGFVKGFKPRDVRRTLLSPQSKKVWDISPSSRDRLSHTLNSADPMYMQFSFTFDRPSNTEAATTSLANAHLNISATSPIRRELARALTSNAEADIPMAFPSIFYLDRSDRPKDATDLPRELRNLTVSCQLKRQNTSTEEWWTLLQSSPHVIPFGDDANTSASSYPLGDWIEVITLSERVPSAELSFLASYGIIGLYVSVVLVVGRFIRMMVEGVSQKIMFQAMPQVRTIRNLCNAIYTARENGSLYEEEQLFRLLIRLYRSPESLIAWTELSLYSGLAQAHRGNTHSLNDGDDDDDDDGGDFSGSKKNL